MSKSPAIPVSPPTEETITPNIIIEELPDNFVLDKKKQDVIADYEILSKSSEGNASDYTTEDESQNDRKKRTADDDLAEVATPPHVNSEGGLIIKEIHETESIEKEKVECAAIIEEEESNQEKGNTSKFKKSKKRKTNDKRYEPTAL
ncbi:unnamed protein product [Rhizophagus irregularis]|uniref:Uncharacterized protein n=1 Tax=Rhizophagus irregularis TaxID=588596 RepID=A0A2N1MPA2_9GLOM|nr:hypothetical protein RhiirC2_788862 [Rhizophagus irregularis]CAB4391944.1 unnamed protein product [Rhizophagus irregularis]CAB5373056.1 unnamed protein product [Rhizophagus irregularis]